MNAIMAFNQSKSRYLEFVTQGSGSWIILEILSVKIFGDLQQGKDIHHFARNHKLTRAFSLSNLDQSMVLNKYSFLFMTNLYHGDLGQNLELKIGLLHPIWSCFLLYSSPKNLAL